MASFATSFSTGGTGTGTLIIFSGGISGGRSSSRGEIAGAAFGVLISTDLLGGLEARVSENETGAATAGFEVTLNAAGAATGFVATGEGLFCSTGAGLASTTVCLGLPTTVFSFAALTSHSSGAGAGTNVSPVLGFPCLPAFTTFGVKRLAGEVPGAEARGDGTGDRGVEEEADFGEVGEEEEADIEERFLLAGTAFGAEAPCLASLPLGLEGPEAA